MDKGKDFLHNHPGLEKKAGLDSQHVIVDYDAWEKARKYMTTPTTAVATKINPEPKKRYFIVFYRLFRANGGLNYWYANIDTEGEYLNHDEIIIKIKDKLNDAIDKDNHKVESIIIQNIVELNESDYEDWKK